MQFLLLIALIPLTFLSSLTSAAVRIPTGLDVRDQKEVLEILGLGSSTKFLSEPYPLGGFSGFEIGIAWESIETTDLSALGDTTPEAENFSYPKVTFGKGLFNDVDLYFNFVPFNSVTDIRHFGGLLKWSFYQTTFLPASFSLLIHGSTSNIDNDLSVQTGGASLITGITMTHLSVYFGGGRIFATGKFNSNLTASGARELSNLNSAHFIAGATMNFEPIFISFELNQYTQPVFSFKVGARF